MTAMAPVRLVDADVHPSVHPSDDLTNYAPEAWRDRVYAWKHALLPRHSYYDPPDALNMPAQRADTLPPDGSYPCAVPDFAFQQLMVEAGMDLAILQPFMQDQVKNPEDEHAIKLATNAWLTEVWLDAPHNWHERWRGSIYVTHRMPELAAAEIEKWAGHPRMAQVLMTPQTRGVQFGDPRLDPIYEAASRNGLPVATHLSQIGPFELSPIFPVGNPSHWAPFVSSWPLVFMSHVMSLIYDGTFERFPELTVIFVEGAFTWALPLLWRMDRMWEARKADVPQVKRRPSEYARDHIRFTTQPLEDAETSEYKKYIGWMDPDMLLFSTDYPHWTYDDPEWASKRFPAESREAIMCENARALFNLPAEVPEIAERLAPA
jgi:predicted TIM-barrel fold metal-dependent hydrolase